MFGTVVTQVDQNLVVMQIIEETAARHGLAALLQEKPFAGINGSGKHNNWSISTTEGAQLMVPSSLIEASGNPTTFPVVMAAVVAGVSKHGDMMRMVTFPTSPHFPWPSTPGFACRRRRIPLLTGSLLILRAGYLFPRQ